MHLLPYAGKMGCRQGGRDAGRVIRHMQHRRDMDRDRQPQGQSTKNKKHTNKRRKNDSTNTTVTLATGRAIVTAEHHPSAYEYAAGGGKTVPAGAIEFLRRLTVIDKIGDVMYDKLESSEHTRP